LVPQSQATLYQRLAVFGGWSSAGLNPSGGHDPAQCGQSYVDGVEDHQRRARPGQLVE
jgi:hypothetical protein